MTTHREWMEQVDDLRGERDRLQARNAELRGHATQHEATITALRHELASVHKQMQLVREESERMRLFVGSLAESPANALDVEMIVAAASTILAGQSEGDPRG